jgi:hypothetical protein
MLLTIHINLTTNSQKIKSIFYFYSIVLHSIEEDFIQAQTADLMFSDLVPCPRHLTLERQLNKSVLIGWNPPDNYGHHQIESYHVYVDGNIKVTVKAAERTRALVEGVDCNRVSCQF